MPDTDKFTVSSDVGALDRLESLTRGGLHDLIGYNLANLKDKDYFVKIESDAYTAKDGGFYRNWHSSAQVLDYFLPDVLNQVERNLDKEESKKAEYLRNIFNNPRRPSYISSSLIAYKRWHHVVYESKANYLADLPDDLSLNYDKITAFFDEYPKLYDILRKSLRSEFITVRSRKLSSDKKKFKTAIEKYNTPPDKFKQADAFIMNTKLYELDHMSNAGQLKARLLPNLISKSGIVNIQTAIDLAVDISNFYKNVQKAVEDEKKKALENNESIDITETSLSHSYDELIKQGIFTEPGKQYVRPIHHIVYRFSDDFFAYDPTTVGGAANKHPVDNLPDNVKNLLIQMAAYFAQISSPNVKAGCACDNNLGGASKQFTFKKSEDKDPLFIGYQTAPYEALDIKPKPKRQLSELQKATLLKGRLKRQQRLKEKK